MGCRNDTILEAKQLIRVEKFKIEISLVETTAENNANIINMTCDSWIKCRQAS